MKTRALEKRKLRQRPSRCSIPGIVTERIIVNVFKAIVTRYRPATNKLGPRYVATDNDGNRVSIKENPEWNDSMNQGHRAACEALCKEMDWHGGLVEGALCGVGRVWVWRQSGVNGANEIVV